MPFDKKPILVWILFFTAVAFGLLTIKSGASVLFFDGEARQAAGNYVPFVLWFNFLAGFLYVAIGVGFLLSNKWAPIASLAIAALTLFIFAALGIHIINGGNYELRTIYAMSFRTIVWVIISYLSWHFILDKKETL